MNDIDAKPRPHWRPRFSLLAALGLTTIVGLLLVIVQLWREVGPLRAEVRRLRSEVGSLTIEDPTKAYGISIPTFEKNTWKWRLYLPPGGKYSLHMRSGHLPARAKLPGGAWFDELLKRGSGGSSSGSTWGGEFMLEARLIQENDDWVLVTRHKSTDGPASAVSTSKNTIYPDEWLADSRSQSSTSDIPATKQASFEPGDPFLLLHIMRPVIKETPGGGYTITAPSGPADGFAVWIQQE